MTLILNFDLDMVKMHLHAKNEVSMLRGSKVIAWTDRHTDTQTDRHIDRQTDRHTDRHDRKHYLPAYAGGNKRLMFELFNKYLRCRTCKTKSSMREMNWHKHHSFIHSFIWRMCWFHNDPSVLSHKAPLWVWIWCVFFSQCFKYLRVYTHLLSEEDVVTRLMLALVHSPTNMLKRVWVRGLWKPLIQTNMSRLLGTNFFYLISLSTIISQ